MLMSGCIFQDTSNLNLQYRRLLPTYRTLNGLNILLFGFLQLCFARMFHPLSITNFPFFSG
jgi:hypothetical protein